MAATILGSEALPLFPCIAQNLSQPTEQQILKICSLFEELLVMIWNSISLSTIPFLMLPRITPWTDLEQLTLPFLIHARSELSLGLNPRQLALYQQLIGHELSWLKDSLSLPLRYSYMRSHRLAQAEDVPKEAIIDKR